MKTKLMLLLTLVTLPALAAVVVNEGPTVEINGSTIVKSWPAPGAGACVAEVAAVLKANPGARRGIAGRYFVVSNLRIVGGPNRDSAPINAQYASDHWRIVNNDLSWPNAPSDAKAGGFTGGATNVAFLGNHIHDINGPYENHGIYLFTGSRNIEIGWNLIERVKAGNLLQTYDGTGPVCISGIVVHDNLLSDGGRYGLNIANQTCGYEAFKNTIRNTALAGVRFDIPSQPTVDLWVHGNRFENVNTIGSPSSQAVVNCDWQLTNATRALVEDNDFIAGAAAKRYVDITGSGCSALKFSGNRWSGIAGQTDDSSAVNPNLDPRR